MAQVQTNNLGLLIAKVLGEQAQATLMQPKRSQVRGSTSMGPARFESRLTTTPCCASRPFLSAARLAEDNRTRSAGAYLGGLLDRQAAALKTSGEEAPPRETLA